MKLFDIFALGELSKAFKLTFRKDRPAAVIVLENMAKFCRANETCVVPGNPDLTLMLEGRREVWLHFQKHIGLTDNELLELYRSNVAA